MSKPAPTLRVYDHQGAYLYDIGAPGQGPGEFQEPSSIAIAADGRLFLRDDDAHRIWMYTQAGEYLGAYQMTGGLHTSTPLTLSPDDVPYTPVVVRLRVEDPRRMFVLAMQAHGEDGAYGDQILPPIDETFSPGVASNEQGSVQRNVPFYPAEQWALTPELALVFGVSRSYRFEPPADMRFSPRPYIDGDLVIARAEDDDAMSMVKRYRLARPE